MRKAATMCAALLLLITGTAAADTQSLASIRQAAEAFIKQQAPVQRLDAAEVTAGRLDKRLRLPLCDQTLNSFLPAGARLIGKTNVGVRCNGSSPWTLYVPVNITAYTNVPTVTYPMQRGSILTADDLTMVRQSLSQLPAGHLSSIDEAIGMELRRNVPAGKPLTKRMVAAPKIIKRGQQVTLVARSDGFEVRMNGKAMADGAEGDRIRVQNTSSKTVVEGTVDRSGAILVDP